jgi:hypothetical protein
MRIYVNTSKLIECRNLISINKDEHMSRGANQVEMIDDVICKDIVQTNFENPNDDKCFIFNLMGRTRV